MKTARPFVLINMAMSADGKIAPPHRRFVAFGSRRDHANLLALRATADAVMCGARTVDSAPVTLDAGGAAYARRRLRGGLGKQNLRIVVSGSGSVDPGAAIFRHPGSPLIVLSSGQAPKSRLAQLKRLADCVKVCGKKQSRPCPSAWLASARVGRQSTALRGRRRIELRTTPAWPRG